jgi:hypothetical protein
LRTKVEEIENSFFFSSTEELPFVLELSYSSDCHPIYESASIKTATGGEHHAPLFRVSQSVCSPSKALEKAGAGQKGRP